MTAWLSGCAATVVPAHFSGDLAASRAGVPAEWRVEPAGPEGRLHLKLTPRRDRAGRGTTLALTFARGSDAEPATLTVGQAGCFDGYPLTFASSTNGKAVDWQYPASLLPEDVPLELEARWTSAGTLDLAIPGIQSFHVEHLPGIEWIVLRVGQGSLNVQEASFQPGPLLPP